MAGVRIHPPERLVYPDLVLTKLDLARYYERVAPWILPHLEGRPLTLVRCPDGVGGPCQYMRHSRVYAPRSVRRVAIQELHKVGTYLVVDDLDALLALVQLDVLELHTWNSRADHVEHPDRIVIDLDPGPLVTWPDVVRAAFDVRDTVAALGLASFVKTTGGRGLHVVVPLVPDLDVTRCLAFARALAETMVRREPNRYTTRLPKAGREAKILLDYLRNNRTNTSVAAFSTRARPGAVVSVPLAWDELERRRPPDRFTIRSVPRRLAHLGADPWEGYFRARQRIGGPVRAVLLGTVEAPSV